MIVDVHAHYVPTGLLESLNAERRLFPSVVVLGDAGSMRMAFAGHPPTRPVAPKLADIGQRKEWLAAQGVEERDIAVQLGHTDAMGRPYTRLVQRVYVHPSHDAALERIEEAIGRAA